MKKTNTGEGDKGKRGRTVSDDTGGKSLSEKSMSVCGQCVGENSTGAKSIVIRSSVNIFQVSKSEKSQYFVDVVKDKRRTKNNNLEFLIGWCGFPDPIHDTGESLPHLSGSEHMMSEDRKRFYLVSSLLDPRSTMLSFCDNKYFPSHYCRWTRLSFNGLQKFFFPGWQLLREK